MELREVAHVRLCLECGRIVLRAMRVRDDLQRLGLGRQLLSAAETWIGDAEAFCLPYSHLERFYASIGFRRVPSEDLPEHLQARLAEYSGRGRRVIGMRRSGRSRLRG